METNPWQRKEEIERRVDALFEWSDKEVIRILSQYLKLIRGEENE